MSGGNLSQLEITLRNPVRKQDRMTVYVDVDNHQLAQDWLAALEEILSKDLVLEKNYCWLGWPWSPRGMTYLCDQVNHAIDVINDDTGIGYIILDKYRPDNLSEELLNRLHYHFEQLQGTVEDPSKLYEAAHPQTRDAIRKLNLLCHEIETLKISQDKYLVRPEWIRPSTIVTFLHAKRYNLTNEHRQLFTTNRYDREFGRIYMHWCQIGKTYYEVWRDEHAPKLTHTMCSAITNLKYYSGEFDIEWGRTIGENLGTPWHDRDMKDFRTWLNSNGLDANDTQLSLGYLPIAKIDFERSFGTTVVEDIWRTVSQYQDIYAIKVGNVYRTYDYLWSDENYAIMIKDSI
jgi:hypothetical protein